MGDDDDLELLESPSLFSWRPVASSELANAEPASAEPPSAEPVSTEPVSAEQPGIEQANADPVLAMYNLEFERRGALLEVCDDPAAGRYLVVKDGGRFEKGDDILREEPAAVVLLSEPWSALESALAGHFNLSKLAPPYRLLARLLEDEHHPRYGRMLSADPDGFVQNMAANLEVADSKWPLTFCTFLAEEANRAHRRGGGGGGGGGAPTLEAVVRMLSIIKTNAFGIYEAGVGGLSNVGLGLYPLFGRANHECDPSAVWTFDGTQAVLRALRPLRAGEQVTISYVLSREPPAARQHKLRESYRFECGCARCAREAPDARKLAGLASEFKEVRARLEAAQLPPALLGEGVVPMARRAAELLSALTPAGCCHPESAICWFKLGATLVAAAGGSGACREEGAGFLRRAHGMLRASLGSQHHTLPIIEQAMAAAGSGGGGGGGGASGGESSRSSGGSKKKKKNRGKGGGGG